MEPITTIPERPFRGRMPSGVQAKVFAVPTIKYDAYLSGPITSHGAIEDNLRMFAQVALTLRERGLRVFSPPENEPPGLSWSDYLRRDLVELMSAATVVSLPGFERSRGALLEADIAMELGIPVLTLDEALAAAGVACAAAPFIPPIDPEGDPDDIIEVFEAEFGELMCDPPVPNPKYTEPNAGRTFSTGSVRDTIAGKGRFDLLPPRALREVARHFQRGAEKYGERNWEKGQPIRSSFLDSAFRHLMSVLAGEKNEDHLVACAWNILCAIETRERVAEGILPAELNDLP